MFSLSEINGNNLVTQRFELVTTEIETMLTQRRLSVMTPEVLGEPDGNLELVWGVALGVSTGIGVTVALLAIGYYFDLDGTRSMLQLIVR